MNKRRVVKLLDVIDESHSLEGIDTPVQINRVTVSPGRLSDGERRAVIDGLVKARRTTCD